MRITIDNLDGQGALEYTEAVCTDGALEIQRGLNVPSRCTAEVLVGRGLPLPVRRARVVVNSEADDVLFTGYVTTEPVRVYAGEASDGPVYRARLTAVSDEWLLDRAGSGAGVQAGVTLSLDGASLVERLALRAAGALSVSSSATAQTGAFAAKAGVPWSVNAGEAAGAAYSSYRAVAGRVLLQPAGSVTHSLSDADGTLSLAELQTGSVRELANDVTLTGLTEPWAMIVEEFTGDGSTEIFNLSEPAFRDAERVLLRDSFAGTAFDSTLWVSSDPGAHLSISGAGLTMNGGSGADGQTTLTALDAVEMGGSVVVQLGGVMLGAASDGMLGGLYEGDVELANCFAGFRVRQSVSSTGGSTVLVPVVNGAEVGAAFTPVAGHAYTLRLRLHCPEMHRVAQRYYCMVDGAVQSFGGGGSVPGPMDAVFELVDEGVSSNTPATVLYDSAASAGAIASTPATCVFVAANATQMFGSVSSVELTRPGSAWVVSTLPNGVRQTRLMGAAGQGVDGEVSYGTAAGTPGAVTFFAGRVPAAGERVSVFYRGSRRSVARLQDAASVAAEALGDATGTSRWLGKVLQPVARSSADCESAAQAVLAMATSRTAAVAGRYAAVNPAEDVWPGDVLQVTSAGVTSSLLVRSVALKDGHAVPEVVQYEISFANDWATGWADGLGVKLSETVANDAELPALASNGPADVLANLPALAVTSLTNTILQLDAGVVAPAGGGFEVRRRDDLFGVGVDGVDLVLRSPVREFSIPRSAQVERFFVRMYDGSTPPVYSRCSSAVFVKSPVS